MDEFGTQVDTAAQLPDTKKKSDKAAQDNATEVPERGQSATETGQVSTSR